MSELGSVSITGATGIVGWSIAMILHERGERVRVLARNVERTRAALPLASTWWPVIWLTGRRWSGR